MKNLLLLVFVYSSLFSFSQGAVKTEIDWIPLEKAKKYAKKYDKNILVFFYKKECPYCEEMKKETLSDQTVIDLININFLAVKIDSRTKDTIYYNNKAFGNQQPASSGRHDWRHDFYHEVARFNQKGKELTTTPTIVLFNSKFEKLTVFAGKQPKPLLLRRIKPYIK
ncbi:thioredoxin family protein [Flavobacteriales bacterium]|nr:thioredoxin family protein [Flavobacteriales bacterium]